MSATLKDKRIALLFYTSAEYSIRILQNVELLKSQGAKISLLSTLPNNKVEDVFEEIIQVDSFDYPGMDPRRLSKNEIIKNIQLIAAQVRSTLKAHSRLEKKGQSLYRALIARRNDFDLYWAIDVVSLEAAARSSMSTGIPLVYETVDLVPEYQDEMAPLRRHSERKYIASVAKFITAGDAYAKYYNDKYSDLAGYQEPFVLYNTSSHKFDCVKPTEDRRKLLFFGNLAFDRPIQMIMEAVSKLAGEFTLTFMGRNLNGQESFNLIKHYGLSDRVEIVDPCNPLEGVDVARNYDIGIAALDGSDLNERLAPTGKIGTYLNAGLAIVASDLPGMRSMIGDAPAFWVKNPNSESWVCGLQAAIDLPQVELDERKRASLNRFKDISFNKKSDEYLKLFEDALT